MYSKRCSAGHSTQFRTGLNRLAVAELVARDLVVFKEMAGVDDGWGLPWPAASDVDGVSAFFHGHEAHSASLALAILARSAFNSALLFSSSTGSGPRVWGGIGVVGRCRSVWRLASSCAATERDLRHGTFGGSPPSRWFVRASRRLASRPATTDRPRGLIAVLARYWRICERGRKER